MKKRPSMAVLVVMLCSLAVAWDDTLVLPKADVSTGKYLYTKSDPSAKGGIKGTITSPADTVVGVYALCPNQSGWCYAATLSGSTKHDFEFTGLPMEKYDLVILFKSAIYEGLTLTKEKSTLTTKDRQMIQAQVQKSEPFFDQKIVLRVEGQTGKGSKANGLALFLRNKESDSGDGVRFNAHRRSLKMIYMTQVGPGWQMGLNREIYVNFVKAGTGPDIKDYYRSYLGAIRVTDTVKDLGAINLTKVESAKPQSTE